MSQTRSSAAIVLRPHDQPFDFQHKWSHPLWKRCGVYLWTIDYRGAYLASYAGMTFGGTQNFDGRIWQEYKHWKAGKDYPVDIEAYLSGRRVELASPPQGHLERELAAITPALRWWLMPLDSAEDCAQAEKWLVHRLCGDEVSRQFLANRNPGSYVPDPAREVVIEAPPSFRVVGLTVSGREL